VLPCLVKQYSAFELTQFFWPLIILLACEAVELFKALCDYSGPWSMRKVHQCQDFGYVGAHGLAAAGICDDLPVAANLGSSSSMGANGKLPPVELFSFSSSSSTILARNEGYQGMSRRPRALLIISSRHCAE
jgi:hypothetical protein